ncbi:uncharacterized protein LOC120637560 [Pararge aegeria]|uniref:uncharacterized protein LOC120637560 n=1 Tax=Pararge aegeria TaxID=116150 RepID=UPI0019CFBC36|nr:uncharacterized protein LOC120637560 [Pararge aegeria]
MAEIKYVSHIVKFPKTIVGYFKQACWEIPEIMGASAHGLAGLLMGTIGLYNIIKNDGNNPEYKKLYMIMRPDDPRTKRLKNPVYTKYRK